MHEEPADTSGRNRILKAFPPSSRQQLRRHMQKVTLTPRQSIFRPGEPMEHVYFPDSGLISLVKSMSDGRTVEVGVIGIDGAAGLFSLYEIE